MKLETDLIKINGDFVLDKVDGAKEIQLSYLFNQYFQVNVVGSPKHTYKAKIHDLQQFLKFYINSIGVDSPTYWTPSVSKSYQKYLYETLQLKPTTVNRRIATLRHAASWISKQYSFQWGNPFEGVKDIDLSYITWKGLSDKEIMRLKAACDIRMAVCKRKNQNPLLEATIFYVLLHTGIREMELCKLNFSQYSGKGFIDVKRKGNKVTQFVSVPIPARTFLDKYLETRSGLQPNDPLFINRKGNRLSEYDVYYACKQIKMIANAKLPASEYSNFTPHSLRHAFLKRVADKHDMHIAQELSGNVSIKEIYRYTRPSAEEVEEIASTIFD